MKALLYKFIRSRPFKHHGSFGRFDVFKSRLLSIYVHEFYRSDKDRCLHDHPWHFLTFILKDGYIEEMYLYPDHISKLHEPTNDRQRTSYYRRPRSILWRPARTAHRILLIPGSHPWSLVFVGPKVRAWGFHSLAGWIPWKQGDPDPACE